MIQLRDPFSFEKLCWNCLLLLGIIIMIILIIVFFILSRHDEEGKFSSGKYTSQGTVKKGEHHHESRRNRNSTSRFERLVHILIILLIIKECTYIPAKLLDWTLVAQALNCIKFFFKFLFLTPPSSNLLGSAGQAFRSWSMWCTCPYYLEDTSPLIWRWESWSRYPTLENSWIDQWYFNSIIATSECLNKCVSKVWAPTKTYWFRTKNWPTHLRGWKVHRS